MKRQYNPWFIFVDTEQAARDMVERENRSGTYYKRKNHRAHYTPWNSADGKEHKFIVWTVR